MTSVMSFGSHERKYSRTIQLGESPGICLKGLVKNYEKLLNSRSPRRDKTGKLPNWKLEC